MSFAVCSLLFVCGVSLVLCCVVVSCVVVSCCCCALRHVRLLSVVVCCLCCCCFFFSLPFVSCPFNVRCLMVVVSYVLSIANLDCCQLLSIGVRCSLLQFVQLCDGLFLFVVVVPWFVVVGCVIMFGGRKLLCVAISSSVRSLFCLACVVCRVV